MKYKFTLTLSGYNEVNIYISRNIDIQVVSCFGMNEQSESTNYLTVPITGTFLYLIFQFGSSTDPQMKIEITKLRGCGSSKSKH